MCGSMTARACGYQSWLYRQVREQVMQRKILQPV